MRPCCNLRLRARYRCVFGSPGLVSDADEGQTLTVRLKQGDDLLDTQTVATPADNKQITFAMFVFPPGEHLLTIEVDDGVETGADCHTTVTINADAEPPNVACPPNQSVNATSLAGALVNYPAAVVTDNCHAIANYSKESGTLFAVGDTTVMVTATDGAGNQSTCTFSVHVKGANEQINDLIAKVNGLAGVKDATKNALVVKLLAALAAAAKGDTATECARMADFISLAKAQKEKKLIPASAADSVIADATRIKAVLGCP